MCCHVTLPDEGDDWSKRNNDVNKLNTKLGNTFEEVVIDKWMDSVISEKKIHTQRDTHTYNVHVRRTCTCMCILHVVHFIRVYSHVPVYKNPGHFI